MTNPVEAVVAADPYPYYASLVAERPFAFDPAVDAWVAAGAAQVDAVLRHPGLRVRPPAEPVPAGIVGSPAGEVFSSLVRMTDGTAQQRLKGILVGALGNVDEGAVRELTAVRARAVAGAGITEIMFGVPARVVAALCGLEPDAETEAAKLIGDFVQCIPAGATPGQQRSAATAAGRLRELLRLPARPAPDLLGELARGASAAGAPADAVLANAIGLLSQAYDATAGLIGNSLVALSRGFGGPGGTAAFVREVARYDAPVQNTRRFAAGPVRLGGADIETGQTILVLLAAANRDPAANADPDTFQTGRPEPRVFTFGAAAHQCPGRRLAVTIASAVVDELLARGFGPGELPDEISYLPSANARIPRL